MSWSPDDEIDLSIYGEWDGVERMLQLFPEFRPVMESDDDFDDRLPHLVFGMGWWPWIGAQLDSPDRQDLLHRSAVLFSEMLATGNEAWREVAVLSGLKHFLRDHPLWDGLRAVADEIVDAEMTRMEPHYRLPWRDKPDG